MIQRMALVVNGNKLQEVGIRPGTTAADVIRELSLPDSYWLSARDGAPFAKDELMFDRIRDGEKLFVSAPADVAI